MWPPGRTKHEKPIAGRAPCHWPAPTIIALIGPSPQNNGDTFTTGPVEAAYVTNRLVQPAAVIASHANEEATKDGKVIEGTRTATFIEMSTVPVHVPLSGKTMSFDAGVKCTEGC